MEAATLGRPTGFTLLLWQRMAIWFCISGPQRVLFLCGQPTLQQMETPTRPLYLPHCNLAVSLCSIHRLDILFGHPGQAGKVLQP